MRMRLSVSSLAPEFGWSGVSHCLADAAGEISPVSDAGAADSRLIAG
jgi:hypothetical protein